MHRCAMLEFEGKSYRLKEAPARIAITAESSYSSRLAMGEFDWPKVGEFEVAIGALLALRYASCYQHSLP